MHWLNPHNLYISKFFGKPQLFVINSNSILTKQRRCGSDSLVRYFNLLDFSVTIFLLERVKKNVHLNLKYFELKNKLF